MEKYNMNDSVGQKKCLGSSCPNHCCSEKFIGLSASLDYKDDLSCGKPLLSKEEELRIINCGFKDYIEYIDNRPYLKVYDNNRCFAFKEGKCAIYDARPDACRLYPFFFDNCEGLCKDKNCPGNFTKDDVTMEHYEILERRIRFFKEQQENND